MNNTNELTNISLDNILNKDIEINDEKFVVIAVNGVDVKQDIKRYSISAYRENDSKVENKIYDSFFEGVLSSVFPGFDLLLILNKTRELQNDLTSNKGLIMELTKDEKFTNNLNPNLAFLPISPLYMPEKPKVSLWDKIKKDILEEKKKTHKKKKVGLGSY